jgi:cytoskeletal protein CcmA (bactofilin family)
MADQTDKLGLPNKLLRSAAGATLSPVTNSLSPPGPASALPPTPGFLTTSGQRNAPSPPKEKTDLAVAFGENAIEARKLIVGPGISLSGEIDACDRLVVEGRVQANLQKCRHMIIAESGLFDGHAAIDDAEVSGRFEGDLIVHKRLLIRASGLVSGTIRYGEIEIEAGGRISGIIEAP